MLRSLARFWQMVVLSGAVALIAAWVLITGVLPIAAILLRREPTREYRLALGVAPTSEPAPA